MKIYLIRHGETTGDLENRYGGDYDDSLTEEGLKQAEQLAEELKDLGIEEIYSSPLTRARLTTSKLCDKHRCKVVTLPGVKERNFYGILTGMTKEEAFQKHADIVHLLEDRNNTLPGGDSYGDFSSRVEEAWDQITDPTYETAAVVKNAGPIRCIFRDILGKGELGKIGDCSYVYLSDESGDWEIMSAKGVQLQ